MTDWTVRVLVTVARRVCREVQVPEVTVATVGQTVVQWTTLGCLVRLFSLVVLGVEVQGLHCCHGILSPDFGGDLGGLQGCGRRRVGHGRGTRTGGRRQSDVVVGHGGAHAGDRGV